MTERIYTTPGEYALSNLNIRITKNEISFKMDINYFICSTHRSGSNLLYNMLSKTELAGNPLELFLCLEPEWRAKYPQYWPDKFIKEIPPEIFLEYIKQMGTGGNGVFGCKMMWESFTHAMEFLRNIPKYKEKKGADILSDIFPKPKYILISRQSKVKQAVSYSKAKKSGIFFQYTSNANMKNEKLIEYDFISIFNGYQKIIREEMNWMRFLVENGITFKNVLYEELAKDPITVSDGVLKFLDLDVSLPIQVKPDFVKQSDEINDYWAERFTQDMLKKGFTVT